MPTLRRLATSLSVGTTLTVVLAGCPVIAGLDHEYSAGGPGVQGDAAMDSTTGTDTGGRDVAAPDGSHPSDGGRDARTDGAHPSDAPAVDGSSGDTGTTGDSGGDVVSPPSDGGADACTATCSVSAVSGWTLIAFDPSGNLTCPGGYTQSSVVTATGVGSCPCSGCTITPTPDCGKGSVTSAKNASVGQMTCGVAGDTYAANEGNCVAGGIVSPPQYSSFMATAPGGGACSATATPMDPSTQTRIFCQSATSCATSVCDQSLRQKGFKECLYQSGAQTCPTGFTTPYAVGSSITTQCDTCTCAVGTTTCTGSFNIYAGSAGCAGGLRVSVPTTGACMALTGVVNNDSYQYVYTTHPSCSNGSSNATDTTNDPATICCP